MKSMFGCLAIGFLLLDVSWRIKAKYESYPLHYSQEYRIQCHSVSRNLVLIRGTGDHSSEISGFTPCDVFASGLAPGFSDRHREGGLRYRTVPPMEVSRGGAFEIGPKIADVYHIGKMANIISRYGVVSNRVAGMEQNAGFIDCNGTWVIKPQFDWARRFVGDRAAVYRDGYWGAIDFNATIRVPLKYQRITDLYEGKWMAAMDWNDNVSIIDKNGSHVEGTCHSTFEIPRWYPLCEVEGYTSEETKARNQVLKREMKQVRHFSCGLAAVQRKDDGLWGFVDEESKFVIPPMYEKVSDFCFDFAWVKHKDSEWITIGTDGKEKEVSEELRENVAKEFSVLPKMWP